VAEETPAVTTTRHAEFMGRPLPSDIPPPPPIEAVAAAPATTLDTVTLSVNDRKVDRWTLRFQAREMRASLTASMNRGTVLKEAPTSERSALDPSPAPSTATSEPGSTDAARAPLGF
jgi:hypothetical protein